VVIVNRRTVMKAKKKGTRRLVVAGMCLAAMIMTTQVALAAQINSTLTFTVIPGAGGTNAAGTAGSVKLNCGWHSSCLAPYPSGTGVDWGSTTSSTAVYLRAKVTNSIPTTSTKSAYAKVFGSTFSGGCRMIVAEIWGVGRNLTSSADDEHMMNLKFLHATPSTAGTVTYNFNGHRYGLVSGVAIGSMTNDSGGGCGWTGYHLHSEHSLVDGRTVTRNTGAIPNAAPACPPDPGACNTFKTGGTVWTPPSVGWERKVSWVFCYSNCLV
jgi:hypothetical protein